MTSLSDEDMPADRPLGPLLPSRQYEQFLPAAEADGLLQWAVENRARFAPARLTGGVLDPSRRQALKLGDLDRFHALLEASIVARLPDIFRDTGTQQFAPDHIEIELTAHGDGAFFRPHSDVPIGVRRDPDSAVALKPFDRLVSAVYYLHRRPKRFSGGTLRLFRIGDTAGQGAFTEYEPRHNSLVAFPSWAFHEVTRVSAGEEPFENWRFAVNIWICRKPGY